MRSCGELDGEHWPGLPDGGIGGAHLAQGQKERERCFGALVSIGAVSMETIETAAGRGIVEPLLEGVLAEKPVEGSRAVLRPAGVAADRVRRQTRRRDRAGFHGLL